MKKIQKNYKIFLNFHFLKKIITLNLNTKILIQSKISNFQNNLYFKAHYIIIQFSKSIIFLTFLYFQNFRYFLFYFHPT